MSQSSTKQKGDDSYHQIARSDRRSIIQSQRDQSAQDFSPKFNRDDVGIEVEELAHLSKEHLSQEKMYTNPKWQDYQQVAHSEQIAISVINSIINKGSEMLYNKYLDTKMTDHVLKKSFFLSEFSWLPGRFIPDRQYAFKHKEFPLLEDEEFNQQMKNIDQIVEDKEPKLPGSESWRSFNIDVEQKIQIEKISVGEPDPDTASKATQNISKHKKVPSRHLRRGFSGASSTLSSPKMKKDQLPEIPNQTIFGLYEGNVVDMRGQNDIDRVEEQLRLIKERERELKQQKMEMDALRQKEQKEQYQRMKQAQIGDSSKAFTFDYNGQVICTSQVKTDKFPNQQFIMQHQITKAEIAQIDDTTESLLSKRRKKNEGTQQLIEPSAKDITQSTNPKLNIKNDIQQQVSKQQTLNTQNSSVASPQAVNIITTKAQVNSKINQKEQYQFSSNAKDIFYSPPLEMFEKFAINRGVTLIENGKIKKGPLFQTTADSIEVTRLTDISYAKKLSLTKQEYNSLLPLPPQRISEKDCQVKPTEIEEENEYIKQEDAQQQSAEKNPLGKRKNTDSSLLDRYKQDQNVPSQIHSARLSKGQESSKRSFSHQNITSLRSHRQLKPISNDKINIKSVNILQQLALDEQDYVFNLLDRNPLQNLDTKTSFVINSQIHSTQSRGIHDISQNYSQLSHRQLTDPNAQSYNMRYDGYNNQRNDVPTVLRPTDEFNQQILASGNLWGSFGNDPPKPKIKQFPIQKVSEELKEKCTVGQHGKLPRDRLSKKSKQLMSHAHLGAPRIGATMGHGFVGDGFNPTSLVNVKKFFDDIQPGDSGIYNPGAIMNTSNI